MYPKNGLINAVKVVLQPSRHDENWRATMQLSHISPSSSLRPRSYHIHPSDAPVATLILVVTTTRDMFWAAPDLPYSRTSAEMDTLELPSLSGWFIWKGPIAHLDGELRDVVSHDG